MKKIKTEATEWLKENFEDARDPKRNLYYGLRHWSAEVICLKAASRGFERGKKLARIAGTYEEGVKNLSEYGEGPAKVTGPYTKWVNWVGTPNFEGDIFVSFEEEGSCEYTRKVGELVRRGAFSW